MHIKHVPAAKILYPPPHYHRMHEIPPAPAAWRTNALRLLDHALFSSKCMASQRDP
jgi:hypothetical protein